MYVLFTSVPLVGHANPLLRQAEELQRRGHRVAFAGARDFERHVTTDAPTVSFLDLGPLGPIADALHRAQVEASRDPMFLRNSIRILDALWPTWLSMYDGVSAAIAADRPDVAVVDLFSTGGLTAADTAGVPCVVNNPVLLAALSVKLLPPADHLPFPFSGRARHQVRAWNRMTAPLVRHAVAIGASILAGRRLNRLRASRNLPPIDVHELHRHRQVLVDGAFGVEYERPLPPNVAMVGSMVSPRTPPLPPDLDAWLSTGPPVVFVSLGSLAVAPARQLARMAAAFTNDAFRTLWSLKPDQAALLPASATSSLRMLDWAPQAAVLAHPNVKAFVSHCGANSVYESVHAGTPIVGIPMFGDQQDMALRVADAGIGVWLDKRTFTAEELRAAILRVLHDEAFGDAMASVQRAVAAAGGVRRAADLIEAQARTPQLTV
ncbi:MAG TPA: glycosyltransferase [Vicinamibacterales bacterium]|nr:glycosyltransferase [Vicinamibacterales bacterium]